MKVSFNYNKLNKEGNIKMKRNLKIIAAVLITIIMGLSFTACNPAQTATNNLVKDAESFKLYRRVTVINNQTDKVIYEVEGFLNFENEVDGDLSIVMETGKNTYYRHVIHINDRTTFLVEQLDGSTFSPYSYKIRIYAAYPDIEAGK